MSAHRCPYCGGETTYQAFSGGREWFCPGCENTGEYPADETPRRCRLLQSETGRIALLAEMDQELARRREEDSRIAEEMLPAAAEVLPPYAVADAGTCTTLCDDDCETDCHEAHVPTWKRDHQPEDCPSRRDAEGYGVAP